MKVRICKSCGTENSPADIECRECMGDISGIKPVEKSEKIENPEPVIMDNPSATIRDAKKTLALVSMSAVSDGVTILIKDGDILGREHTGRDFLTRHNTVSRQHAKITRSEGEWTIEDLGSMNGTYVNGGKLEKGQKYSFKANDILSLSKSCEFLVKIGEK